MRKLPKLVLEAVSLIALALLWLLTLQAIYGPAALPARIPTHFNLAGNPDAWGSPHTLWLLPALATVLYLVFTAIGSRPGAFRFPVRVTFQNRDRLQALARQMTAFLKAETVLLLAILQYAILHAFRTSHFSLPAWLIPSGVAVLLLTTLVHIAAMRRAG